MCEMRVGDRVQLCTGYDETKQHWEEGHKILNPEVGTLIEVKMIPHRDGDGERLSTTTVRWDSGRIEERNELDEATEGSLEVVTPLLYVNVYLYDRAYGGPEEGGWWYDTYDPVPEECVLAKSVEEAEELVEKKREWATEENKDRTSPSSVNSEGHYVVRQEAWPAEADPAYAPHYC